MQSPIKERLELEARTPQAPVLSARAGKAPWYMLALKILAWQIAAIFVVELCLSLAGLGEEEIFKLDPVLGFKHMSNKRITWRSEGFATSYFDQDGMREPGLTVTKPAGTYRVAILGDSLAESLQVPLEESFASLVETQVSQQLSRPVQVLNFGTSGYSTVQEYLQLKEQVLKYKPDLVLVCYNSRDCFENWSPPDEVLTNVRPAALHLPGRKLAVDSSPVTQWMKTPRARFLKQVEGLRQHSRLWGLYSAAELDWSLHNETYKRVLFFITKPGKAIRKSIAELKTYLEHRQQQFFSSTTGSSTTGSSTTSSPATGSSNTSSPKTSSPATGSSKTSSPKTNSLTTGSSNTATTESKQSGRSNYHQLIARTLGSLLAEMQSQCNAAGARFAVVALPVRSALAVRQGMETSFDGFDFNDEIKMLQEISSDKKIKLINVHENAKSLSAQDKDYLFYLVHLTPKGHEFVAKQLAPVVKEYVEMEPQK